MLPSLEMLLILVLVTRGNSITVHHFPFLLAGADGVLPGHAGGHAGL